MSNQNSEIYNSNEVNLRQIIVTAKSYLHEILKSWKILLLFSAIGIGIFLYRIFTSPINYSSKLTFMVNEDEGGIGGLGAASSILGGLGLGATEFNLDKILSLSKSNRILFESLLKKGKIDGQEDFYGNHFIRIYDMEKKEWKKRPNMQGFRFKSNNIDSFGRLEYSALKDLYGKLIGGGSTVGLYATSYSRESSIMTMNLSSLNEDLSMSFLRVIFETLSDFYVFKSVEKQRYTYDVVVAKADSIRRLLSGKEIAQAQYNDGNRGLILEARKVPVVRLGRDVNMLNVMYLEAVKNAELADFAIKNKLPFIQPIDMPFPPLSKTDTSKTKAVLIGLGLGLFLGFLYIGIKKFIRDSLATD